MIHNNSDQAHTEAKSLLCQHSHKGSCTRSNSALKASIKGKDEVAHVGRHNVCKGWVVAGRPSPTAQAVHGHQCTCIQNDTAWFTILWKTLHSPQSLYAQRNICKDVLISMTISCTERSRLRGDSQWSRQLHQGIGLQKELRPSIQEG